MTLSASNFNVIEATSVQRNPDGTISILATAPATAADIAELNQALDQLAQDSPGQALLAQLGQNPTMTIGFVHNGAISTSTVVGDAYFGFGLGKAGTVLWDPNSGLQVVAEQNGQAVLSATSPGVESPSVLLSHEFAHATDPNYVANTATSNSQYGTVAEQYATGVEDNVGAGLQEPPRYNHTGSNFSMASPDVDIVNVAVTWSI
jgi:hypothetical protein